ncbi:MAG: DUF6069 family protein [Anaerolineae bacterium]|nr:DUF6069 family protein [Anaerolineae bacterium]
MTTKTELTESVQTERSPLRKLLWVTPLAMGLSAAANLVLYAIAGAIAPEVTAWPGASVGQVVGATIVYLLMGTIALVLVARFSSRPVRTYWVVATIGLLLSLVMPVGAGMGYGAPGAPSAEMVTVITLSLMHVVTYAISVPMYTNLVLQESQAM